MATARNRKKRKKQGQNVDYVLLTVVLFLIGFGLLMIYSTSSYDASTEFGNAAHYLKRQFFSTLVGFGALFLVSKIPFKFWQRFDLLGFIVSVILILLVLTPLGVSGGGATRSIDLKIGLTLQPAEVAKLGMIVYLASTITRLGKNVRTLKGFMVLMIPTFIVAGMIYIITDNLSSAVIVVGIAMAMLFVAIPDYKPFVILGILVVAAVVGVVFYALGNDVESFRLVRVKAWLNPEEYSTDKAFQTLQALYAIGSGGIWGKGLGQSMQKRGFLPESQNDMIFSIICEELGLFGAMAVIILFIVLIWSCMVIANQTMDQFGSMLVVGVMAHFAIQVILNIAVVTNTIPNTGITLPFISYGGSAVVFLMAEIGLVLNVSQCTKRVS